MANFLSQLAIAALLITPATLAVAQSSGSGKTTRYWDCCKPSCAWNGIKGLTAPVKSCDKYDKPLNDVTAQSGCAGGTAYMCSNQSPWAVSDSLAYGFAAVTSAKPTCCQCYQLTFTSGPISGKKMIVQATNTGTDVATNSFDIAMPGGGFGIFDGCSTEWKATPAIWGAQYGGPSTNTCSSFPTALQPGCNFRWGWMQGADNPDVKWEMVTCPAAITEVSGCSVSGQAPTGPSSVSSRSSSSSSFTPGPAPASSASASSSISPVAVSSSSSARSSPTPSSSSTYVEPASSAPAASTYHSSTTAEAGSPPASATVTSPASSAESESAPQPTDTEDDTCEL
ncbi:hypothetical protein MMC24_001496 [Lignoscripta atroalba]|nr:hypothetical protein [Lignoscripta atroalba]